jgi:DNA-binding transcriptional regulator GbsR (MarR family)
VSATHYSGRRQQPATTGPARPGSSQPDQAQPASSQPEQPESADGAAGRRDRAAVRGFIERFTAQLTQAGFPRTPARIFVALLTADSSSLTAAQLADLLEASPASVSGGARYLIQVGLVTAEGEPGSRRQHYRMPATVWRDVVSLRDQMFGRWVAELRDGIEVLGADSPAGLRMADTVRYFEFLQVEMAGLLSRWTQHGASRD